MNIARDSENKAETLSNKRAKIKERKRKEAN